jgi:hypothetical protein
MASDLTDVVLTSGIKECARCGEDHAAPLQWHEFTNPTPIARFWTMCPTTEQPLLLTGGNGE